MFAPIFFDRTFGVIRAVIETLDQFGLMEFIVQQLSDSLMHSIDISFSELATRHSALVGYNDQSVAGTSQRQ